MSPTSHALRRTSSGHVPSLSYSQATGRISLTAKSCAISFSAFCSSVRVKSTIGGVSSNSRLTGQSTTDRSVPPDESGRTPVRVSRGASQSTTASPPSSRIAVTSASAYCCGNSAGRRGAMVRRLTRRHMGPWWTMQEAFGIVIFAVVGISVVLAVVSLFFRGRTLRPDRPRRASATTARSVPRLRAAARRPRRARRRDPPDARRPATLATPPAARTRSTSRPSSRASPRRPSIRPCGRRSASS